jgi:thiamine-phosphate pyrophosphorylase
MPLVYYITDRRSCPLPILQQIESAIDASVDLLQIREKDLPTRPLLDLALQAEALARGTCTQILINDRLDLALSAGLAGVHLGNHSVPPAVLRKQAPPDFLIGVSTHSLEEFEQAEKDGASFVTLGPIFHTPSKTSYGHPIGLELLKTVCRQAKIPVLALGGVDRKNFASCLNAGSAGVAAIRLFQSPGRTLKELVEQIHRFAGKD